jgi:hypothetical protein
MNIAQQWRKSKNLAASKVTHREVTFMLRPRVFAKSGRVFSKTRLSFRHILVAHFFPDRRKTFPFPQLSTFRFQFSVYLKYLTPALKRFWQEVASLLQAMFLIKSSVYPPMPTVRSECPILPRTLGVTHLRWVRLSALPLSLHARSKHSFERESLKTCLASFAPSGCSLPSAVLQSLTLLFHCIQNNLFTGRNIKLLFSQKRHRYLILCIVYPVVRKE